MTRWGKLKATGAPKIKPPKVPCGTCPYRKALIEAVWRAGVATGRCLEVEDELLRSRERMSILTHRDALADVKEEAS